MYQGSSHQLALGFGGKKVNQVSQVRSDRMDHSFMELDVSWRKVKDVKEAKEVKDAVVRRREKRNNKVSSFVLKHKINKDLYNPEKEEVRFANSILNNKNEKVGKAIKVKNYTKFMDNIISIE